MADKPETVYFCDHCRRVVARVLPDGTIIIIHWHDRELHETRIPSNNHKVVDTPLTSLKQ